jgi:hypothetical protein
MFDTANKEQYYLRVRLHTTWRRKKVAAAAEERAAESRLQIALLFDYDRYCPDFSQCSETTA